ncbi:hypothetical protein [Streptomyces sp. NPDC050982]|uniref:hypothetical protein n=1 Tax=Streptomyces sp. NPDC050982 TaxID=3154746 RepID=UPI0033CC8031
MGASASETVGATRTLDSRHDAYEVLAALRVLRAHLTFAETAGGLLHYAGERQTAEEAGISRRTLRIVYESVLKPYGGLFPDPSRVRSATLSVLHPHWPWAELRSVDSHKPLGATAS